MDGETQTILNEIKAKREKADADLETIKNDLTGVRAQVQDFGQKLASFSAPKPEGKAAAAHEIAKMLVDRKGIPSIRNAITANGAGAIEVVSEIVRAMVDKGKISSKIRTFFGDNAQVNIPVFYPGMAKPAAKAHGATDGAADTTAEFGPVSLTPFGFISILAVDRLALQTTALEASLMDIFGDAFGEGWENQILNGAGSASYEFTGIFNATWIAAVAEAVAGNIKTAASTTAVTWKELAGLAAAAKAKAQATDRLAMICHPDLTSGLLAATGASPALELEYLTKGTIKGMPVIESTHAPNTMTTGKYVACACDLGKYAGAFVRDIAIDPIKVKGDLNIYEQAIVYANGKPLVEDAFFYLKLA